jgi:hypothetical protein
MPARGRDSSASEIEVRVLGTFRPSRLQSEVIEAELKPYLPACCQRERIGVRTPHERAPDPPEANLQFHQDGGGLEGTTRHIVLWASEDPTEIQTSTGELFTAQPYELVWVNNDRARHRQPRGTNEQRRWFLAVRCSGALT